MPSMVQTSKASLIDEICTSDEMSDRKIDKATLRWNKIRENLRTHVYIMNFDVRELCGVSAATEDCILSKLSLMEFLLNANKMVTGHISQVLVVALHENYV